MGRAALFRSVAFFGHSISTNVRSNPTVLLDPKGRSHLVIAIFSSAAVGHQFWTFGEPPQARPSDHAHTPNGNASQQRVKSRSHRAGMGVRCLQAAEDLGGVLGGVQVHQDQEQRGWACERMGG